MGLPEGTIKESRERITAAISNSGYAFPIKRITCNLAPAEMRKIGSRFDLLITAYVLGARGIGPLKCFVSARTMLSGYLRTILI